MPKLDDYFNLIEDGAWHSLTELSKNSNIPKQKLEIASRLFSEANMVEYRPRKSQVRIKPEWHWMLKNTCENQCCENETVATIVLPSKKRVNVQGIHLTNMAEKELEINVRIKKELEELAIDIIE